MPTRTGYLTDGQKSTKKTPAVDYAFAKLQIPVQ